MASTLWIGNLQLGSINVPVRLHPAVAQNRVQFHLLHKSDKERLRQQMICKFDKAPVSADEQVKGFQVDERKYILVDQEELEQLEPQSGRTIEIHEFVTSGDIDPVYIEHLYHLQSDGADKIYHALTVALKELNVQGICTWVMRKRSYFGAIQSTGTALRLAVLRHADEIVQAKSLGLEEFALSEKELAIGCELIDKLTVPFQPEKYGNEHQKKLWELIEKKSHGQKIVLFKPRHHIPTTPDKLLESLKKSLERVA